MRDARKDSPLAKCLPVSVPFHNFFNLMRVVQTPALTVLLYESPNSPHRTVFTDGRDLPKDPNPAWLGYSIGRWEGDTLVITTAGFNDRGWLDSSGHPQTESLRITERLRRRDFGHMDFEITIDDPKVFTKPFTVKAQRLLAADTDLLEDVCENERDQRQMSGGTGARLTPETAARYAGVVRPGGTRVRRQGAGRSVVRAGTERTQGAAARAVEHRLHVDGHADRLRVRQRRHRAASRTSSCATAATCARRFERLGRYVEGHRNSRCPGGPDCRCEHGRRTGGLALQGPSVDAGASRLVTLDMLKKWEKELSNWGRWGKDDQRGMLNLITPEKTKAALALVKEAKTVTLQINPIKKTGMDTGGFGENLHRMARIHPVTGEVQGALDVITLSIHDGLSSHMDALCHYQGPIGRKPGEPAVSYNGFPFRLTAAGCVESAADRMGPGYITRGILVDMPLLKGVKWLEPSTPIYVEDLEAWEKFAGDQDRRG